MVKKIMIKIVLLVIGCISPVTIFAYDFTNIDDIKRCQGDPNCYVCSNNNTIAQCVQKNPYDSNKGVVDTSVFQWVCNEKEVKQACDVKIDADIIDNKTINIMIPIKYSSMDSSINFNLNKNILNISTQTNGVTSIDIIEKINTDNNFIQYKQSGWEMRSFTITGKYNSYKKTCQKNGKEYKCDIPEKYFTIKEGESITKDTLYTIYPSSCQCINGYNDIIKFYPSLTVSITLERPKTIITCPSDNRIYCYQEGDGYYCSSAECIAGDEAKIEIDEDPSINPDDLVDLDKDESQICSTDGIRIADGNFMSCRLPSSIFGNLTQNCCDMSMDNNEKKKDIISGASDVISAFAGTYALIFDIFEALGWADDDFLGVAIQDILNWFTGGVCSESEIMTSTLSKTTANSGNCVYLGTYCTNYSGTCHKWFGQIIGWYGQCERPAEAYCCYSSVFDKALAKAARDQMPEKYNWGSINGDLVFPNRLHSAGNNPCHPDYEKLNLNCNGVSISDLVNLNLDTPEFNADIEAYVDVLKEDMQKPGGAIDQSVDSANQVIEDIKNNPQDIIDDALKNIDIKGIE